MDAKELGKRKIVVHKYNENPTMSVSEIARKLKMSKSTVYGIIKRYNKTLTVDRAPGSGRKAGPADKDLHRKLVRSIKQNPGLSNVDRAKKFGTTERTVRKTIKRCNLKTYHAIKSPNRTDKQNLTAKRRARLLYDNVLTKFEGCLIMDDETYVKADFKQLPGQKFYVASMRGNVPSKYKFVCQDKYAKKYMVWQAICSCGRKSRAFVTSQTMTSNLYVKECLEKRILPFVASHNVPVKFWPDLASCHYARSTMAWYEAKKVDVIPKDMNPPNCPKLRPIEEYWATVKKILKKNGGASKDINQMLKKWNQAAGKVSDDVVQRLMAAIRRRTRLFFRISD